MEIHVWQGFEDGRVEPVDGWSPGDPLPGEAWVWVDVQGAEEETGSVLRGFGFHPIAVDDAFTLDHHPKIELFDDLLFVIVRGVTREESGHLETAKLAAFLRGRTLVTYHRLALPSVEMLQALLADRGKVASGDPARILYLLCDTVIERYFPILDRIDDEMETIEEEIFEEAREEQLARALELRHELATLRRVMMPHRQVFQRLAFDRLPGLEENLGPYFRDAHDNVLRLAEAIDQQRDLLVTVRDTYLSVVSQRTNDVMKVLTMFSAILLPLTFIAGLYGMNFEYIPELESRYGYFVVLGVMAVAASGMIAWFRRRGWL